MRQVNVQFLCKLCTDSFTKVQNYIKHKKEKHFTEFQKTKCIVFEEAHLDQSSSSSCQAELSSNSKSKSTAKIQSVAHSQNSKKQSKSTITSQRKKQCSKQLKTKLKNKLKPDSKKSKVHPVIQLTRLKSKELESQSYSSSEKKRGIQSEFKNLKYAAHSKSKSKSKLKPIGKEASLKRYQEFHTDPHQNSNSNSAKNLLSCPPPQPQPQSSQSQSQSLCSNNTSIMDFNTFLLKSNQNLKNQDIIITTSLSNLILNRMKKHTCSAENCGKSFATPGNLREHLKRSHSHSSAVAVSQPILTNDMAMGRKKQKIAQNSVQVEEHNKGIKSVPNFECANCSKKFFYKSFLEAHALLHTNTKPFVCSFEGCASAFKRKYDLGIHERGRHGVVKEKKKKK